MTRESQASELHFDGEINRLNGSAMQIGISVCGRMGANMKPRLGDRGLESSAFVQAEASKHAEFGRRSCGGALDAMVTKLAPPRELRLMVPSGDANKPQ